jgi:hypothetical protein
MKKSVFCLECKSPNVVPAYPSPNYWLCKDCGLIKNMKKKEESIQKKNEPIMDAFNYSLVSIIFWLFALLIVDFYSLSGTIWFFRLLMGYALFMVLIWIGFVGFLVEILGEILAATEGGSSQGMGSRNPGISNISYTSPSQQISGHYQCLCGYVQHGSHWGGMRNCPQCGKPMTWRS